MERTPEAVLVTLAVLGFVAWLGGGRKWAFRTLLSALILIALGVTGVLLYTYATEKSAEHRAQKIRECAVAKIAEPKCEKPPKDSNEPKGWEIVEVCPPYTLSDNASPQQEDEALALAEQECREEMNPKEKSLHEQIAQYRLKHGIKYAVKRAIDYDALAKESGGIKSTSGTAKCAAKVRKAYPGAYDDLDDDTLTKKVLAKYPEYCDANPRDSFIPDLKGIR